MNLPAHILKVPVIKFSQALGPFENKFNKIIAKIFLPLCKIIFARGKTR